jgi:hypothetical protein
MDQEVWLEESGHSCRIKEQPCGGCLHPGTAPSAQLDHPRLRHGLEGFANARSTNMELLRELVFGWQEFARLPLASADQREELLDDIFGERLCSSSYQHGVPVRQVSFNQNL